MNYKFKLLLSAAAVFMIAGCGGGGGHSSSTAPTVTNVSGIVTDGYIYNAKVCYLGTDICAVTDINGKFTLEKQPYPLIVETNSSTLNTVTTANYDSVLVAPEGVSVVSPLSTALYAAQGDYDKLSKVLGVDTQTLKDYINKDYVALSSEDPKAQVVYAKNVILEKITEALLLDGNASSAEEKIAAVKSIMNYTSDINKSLSMLSTDDITNIYSSYKEIVNEPVSNVNAEKIAQIVYALASVSESNFTNSDVAELEKKLAGVDIEGMFALDDENLSLSVSSLQNLIVSMTTDSETSDVSNVAADTLLSSTTQTQAPEINASAYIYIQNLSSNSIEIVKGEDFNITDGAVYSVTIEDDKGIFTFSNGANAVFDQSGNVIITVNTDKMTNPTETATLKFTPKSADVVGETRDMLLLVSNPNATLNGLISETFTTDATTSEKTINLSADASTGYQLAEEDREIDVKIDDPDNNMFIFATSSDSKVVKVSKYSESEIILTPVYNGSAKVTVVSLDKSTYLPTFRTYFVNISGIDLPPVLNVKSTYLETVLDPSSSSVSVSIPYSIIDTDGVNNGLSVKGCDNEVNSQEGNITCTFSDSGVHTVSLSASDGYLESSPVSVKVNVVEGNVPPSLYVNIPSNVDLDTMTSQSYSYVAHDLNGDDTLTVTASSSDETVVKASVNPETSQVTLIAQPKVGSATVTIYAQDNEGAKSKVYTVEVNTHNTLSELMPSLYIVPVLDENMQVADGRYVLRNFSASYNIAEDEIEISGEINASQTLTLNNFALRAYPEEALYAGEGSVDGYKYGFVFSNGFEYNGAFKDGRVLVFSMQDNPDTEINESVPYYWALATKDEICNAYGNAPEVIELINSLNKNTLECE